MTVEATAVVKLKRKQPHVDEIGDYPTQQTIRLLWDRIFDLEERLQSVEGTSASLVSASNSQETTLQTAASQAEQALGIALTPGGTLIPSGGVPEEDDGGAGAAGCAGAGPTGHDSGGVLSPTRAGQLVCGTGNEFPALKNPTVDLATRDTNAEELVERMIWHLRQGGFTAGRQRNPSSIISNDKLCVIVDGVLRAYDVLQGKNDYLNPMSTQMNELVGAADMVEVPGLPD